MKSFLFYDLETSGLNPAFDQVLTFAAIRTDTTLNELSRDEICVNLRPDIVPSPGAFLTHGLTPEILENGICEYQAARKIHRLFNTPDTVSCGYNSLGFDDEFLRFLFYRNLLDPYTHQFAKGCSRMDMLPVTVIYRLFCDRVLSWPVLDNGRGTLKLEHLSRENGFVTSGRAHEAMSDVEALLALARCFRKEKEIWDYVQGFFDKKKEDRRMTGLQEAFAIEDQGFRMGLMVSAVFGPEMNYIAPVLHLGGSLPYKNQSLWLRMDTENLLSGKDPETGIYDVFAMRKRPGDQMFILPGLDRFWNQVTPGAKAACQDNIDAIREDPEGFLRTTAFHREFRYPEIPDLDMDAALYQDGFFSQAEKQEMARFHHLAQAGDFEAVEGFSSERIRRMARRVISRNFGNAKSGSPPPHLKRLTGQLPDTQVIGYKNDTKLTCRDALAELDEIESAEAQAVQDPERARMMEWLRRHIAEMSASLA